MKRSSSVEVGYFGYGIEVISRNVGYCIGDVGNWNIFILYRITSFYEGINSDKSMDSGRFSLVLRSSSCRFVV